MHGQCWLTPSWSQIQVLSHVELINVGCLANTNQLMSSQLMLSVSSYLSTTQTASPLLCCTQPLLSHTWQLPGPTMYDHLSNCRHINHKWSWISCATFSTCPLYLHCLPCFQYTHMIGLTRAMSISSTWLGLWHMIWIHIIVRGVELAGVYTCHICNEYR